MEAWLRCDVGSGMFSTEACIAVTLPNGTINGYWADIEAVEPKPLPNGPLVKGRVKGELTYDKDGLPWMRLPVPEYTCIPVRKEDLL